MRLADPNCRWEPHTMMRLDGKTFSYAYWLDSREPETGLPVPGLGSHRFTLFRRPARLRGKRQTTSSKHQASNKQTDRRVPWRPLLAAMGIVQRVRFPLPPAQTLR